MQTIDHNHYTEIFGFPVIDYYRRLGFDFEDESFEIIGTEFIDGYEAHKFELELHKEQDSWSTLDTVTTETGWSDDERRTFEFANVTPYTSYRLNITANNGATSTCVQELSLYEEQNWTTLDTVTGETGWIAWENRPFTIDSPGSYKYYKMDVTNNNGSATLAMSHIQLIPTNNLAVKRALWYDYYAHYSQ